MNPIRRIRHFAAALAGLALAWLGLAVAAPAAFAALTVPPRAAERRASLGYMSRRAGTNTRPCPDRPPPLWPSTTRCPPVHSPPP